MIGTGFRIGRLYGINIRVDWSWLIIAGLVTWNLRSIFAQLHPEWGAAVQWGLAALAALLFFASVLAHEMGHSLVARTEGLPVRNITLFLFGGVAQIEREPPSPRAEFLIAIAGPLVSLLLGVVMLALGIGSALIANGLGSPEGMVSRIGGLSPIATLLVWLGSINLILAIFNLIPGFPLDGGRVLRSALWALTRSLNKATWLASLVGRLIATMMIAAGVAMLFGARVPILGEGIVNGVWLVFIGLFLNNAAVQSYQQVAIQEALDGVSVAQIMFRGAPTVEPERMVGELINRTLPRRAWGRERPPSSAERPTQPASTAAPMAVPVTGEPWDGGLPYTGPPRGQDAYPVVQDGRLVGIVTQNDLARVPQEAWNMVPVREAMTPYHRLVTVTPEEDAAGALDKLLEREVMQAPVVSTDARFLGLLRRRDIAAWLKANIGRKRNEPM